MAIVQKKTGTTDGSGNFTLDSVPTIGNTLVVGCSRRGGPSDLPATGPSWTQHPHGTTSPGSDGGRMMYRPVALGDTATIKCVGILGGTVTVWEIAGNAAPVASSFADVDTGTKPSSVNGGSITPPSGMDVEVLLLLTVHCSDWGGNGDTTISDSVDWTRDGAVEILQFGNTAHPVHWAGHRTISGASGAYATSQGLVGAGNNFGGWAGLALAFEVATAPPDPGIDVGVYNPVGVFIADLEDAYDKRFRVELDGTGTFSFKLNRYSPNATALILARDNVVKYTINQVTGGPHFAGFLEVGDFDLNSIDEQGGEELRFGGRGLLAYLERDVAWTTSYVLVTEPTDGFWRFAPVGLPSWSTGNEPGQILRRIIAEMQDPDRPQHCMDLLTVDFDYQDDSDSNGWAATDATNPVWTVAIGEDVLTTTGRLIATGVLDVQMDTDFGLHAYNHYGRDLTGDDFGADVVRFVKGVNIADRVNRQWAGADIAPYELVAGDGAYVRAELPDYASRVQKVVFNQFAGTSTPVLEALGLADLEQRLLRSESAAFAVTTRRVGGTETADDDGRYLPGPPGTNGDFWVGDLVRLHTGSSDIDYDEQDVRVAAITVAEIDAGNLTVIPELGSTTGQATLGTGTYGGGGVVSAPGSTGGGTTGVRDHGLLFGLADDDHPQYTTAAEATTIADTEVAVHTGDTTDAHDASAISIADAGNYFTGSQVEAALQELGAAGGGGGGTDLGWFNVEDYGAVHDGTTDDTSSIQDAIDACSAAGGGTIFFPRNASGDTIYQIDGALQDTSTYNAQLEIPQINVDHTVGSVSIRFLGGAWPATNQEGQSNVVLRSSWNGTISGNPAIISAGLHDSLTMNYTNLLFEDIEIRAHENPKLTAIDATKAWGLRFSNLTVTVAWSTAFALPTSWVVPTHSNALGVDFPRGFDDGYSGGDGLNVSGYYTGFRPGEQFTALGVWIGFCRQAVDFRGEVNTGGLLRHANYIGRIETFFCPRGIVFSGDERWVWIGMAGFEHEDSVAAAWAAVYDIDDASNYGRGHIGWHTTDWTTGPEDNLKVNGGSGLSLHGAYAKRWRLANVVDIPIGTNPSTNPANGRRLYTDSSTGHLSARDSSGTVIDYEAGASALTIKDEGSSLATAATSIDFVGAGVTASGTGAAKTVTIPGGSSIGEIVIVDSPSTPLVFADLVTTEDEHDLVYADP